MRFGDPCCSTGECRFQRRLSLGLALRNLKPSPSNPVSGWTPGSQPSPALSHLHSLGERIIRVMIKRTRVDGSRPRQSRLPVQKQKVILSSLRRLVVISWKPASGEMVSVGPGFPPPSPLLAVFKASLLVLTARLLGWKLQLRTDQTGAECDRKEECHSHPALPVTSALSQGRFPRPLWPPCSLHPPPPLV